MNNEEEKKKCYTIPLAPTDLVQIYKVKAEDDDFVLFVDYFESREKLSAKHIIIYSTNNSSSTPEKVVLKLVFARYIIMCFAESFSLDSK